MSPRTRPALELVRAAGIAAIIHGALFVAYGVANRRRWANDLADPPVSEFALTLAIGLILALSGAALMASVRGAVVTVATLEAFLVVPALRLTVSGQGGRGILSLALSIGIFALLATPDARGAYRRRHPPPGGCLL